MNFEDGIAKAINLVDALICEYQTLYRSQLNKQLAGDKSASKIRVDYHVAISALERVIDELKELKELPK